MSERTETAKAQEALRAARLYYVQNLTMEAIARELHTSRSSVSRLLSFARETRLVEISIHAPQDRLGRVETELRARHGITAHIVPVPDRISEVDRLERVAVSAARVVADLVDSNQTIGIAWGATLSAVARHLPQKTTHSTQVVQLNGAANVRTSGIPYAGEMLGRFGAAFRAEVHQFPVPALFDDPATKRAMWKERAIRRVLDQQRRSDLLVFGLGSPEAAVPSHVYAGDYFDPGDLEDLDTEGVVGDVATHFYRADGSDDGIPLNARSSGPDLEVIRSIPRRVCVVSGPSKLSTLCGALRAGIVTDLVLDETLGASVLDSPMAE